MKNLMKANGQGKQQVCFPPMQKPKAGIFDDPQIRELMKDTMCDEALSKAERSTW